MDFEGFSKGRNTKGVWKKDEKMKAVKSVPNIDKWSPGLD